MNLNRRQFLHLAALGLSWPLAGRAGTPAAAGRASTPRIVSPASREGHHFAVSLNGVDAEYSPLPMRGHGLLLDPLRPGEALVIARRPGTLAAKVELASGRLLSQWQVEEDRHFFGHACYSADGKTLFTTENNIDTAQGVIGVRDAATFKKLGEFPSHGIGPHELILLPDGKTLAVGNGGVSTLPETGRVKLNRGRIDSDLAYLDLATGKLLAKYPVPIPQLSLRHLARAENGRIAAAMQFEGDKKGTGTPLIAFHQNEDRLQIGEAPQAAWDAMRHYAASVEYDPASHRFALSCPLGDTLACWSDTGEFVGALNIPQVSGIAFDDLAGFASNERGELYRLDLARLEAVLHQRIDGLQWDNHLYLA